MHPTIDFTRRSDRNYVTMANVSHGIGSHSSSISISQQWNYQNDFNLQKTRSYIFFEKGFKYYLNLLLSDSRQEALKLRRERIIIKLRHNRKVMMDKLQAQTKNRRTKIMASVDNMQTKQRKRMNSFYKRRKSAAIQQIRETQAMMMKDFRSYAVTIEEPFRKEWFTKDGYPLTSRDPVTGRFLNPWNSESTNGFKRIVDVWRWKKTRLDGFGSDFLKKLSPKRRKLGVGDLGTADVSENLDFVGSKSLEELKQKMKEPVLDKIKLTWIGHATTLVQFSDKFTLLTDPIFSNKASPIQMFQESEFFGVPRFKPPSLSIEELGKIDVCVISHDHYDHLDLGSVQQLFEKGLVDYWAVPIGLKEWLVDNVGIGEDRIVEMEWWQSVKFIKGDKDGGSGIIQRSGELTNLVLPNDSDDQDLTSAIVEGFENEQDNHDTLILTCAPAQHWCSRSPFDRNTRLWCSWAAHSDLAPRHARRHDGAGGEGPEEVSDSTKLSFYFAGDTGYPQSFPLHRQIGDRLGPFDLAAIPIGAYKPRFFMHDSHCDPKEALRIHQDVRSKQSVAIHWGTFPLANEPFEEPPTLLNEAVLEATSQFSGGETSSSLDGFDRGNRDRGQHQKRQFIAIPHGESVESK